MTNLDRTLFYTFDTASHVAVIGIGTSKIGREVDHNKF